MKGYVIFIFLSIALFSLSFTKQLTCLTGYKILVRTLTKDPLTEQEIYKLQYLCFCPNNYYGKQCEHHINIDCFLSGDNDKIRMVIDESNVKQEMEMEMQFDIECWVGQKNALKQKINLQEYLQKHNTRNAYGVRHQFGRQSDIVWSNTTDIFDSSGEFKIISDMRKQNQSYQLTQQQKLKILIGNNTDLYNNPFTYTDDFLGYGLINGKVRYELGLVHPEKRVVSLKNYTNLDVAISKEVDNNSPSRRVGESQQMPIIPKIDVNETTQKQIADEYDRFEEFLSDKKLRTQRGHMAKVKVPVKIKLENSTFYSTIKLSLDIFETYQQIVTHQVSLNSFIWTIPVEIPSMGYQPNFYKNLIITEQGYKTYYKIILMVLIGCFIYFAFTFGYKKWKERKEKSIQRTQQHIRLQSISTRINN